MTRDVERLSCEISCLTELGALSAEEIEALALYLDELRGLLARARVPDAPGLFRGQQAAPDLAELSGRVELLAGDIDRAYCRLGAAA